MLHVQGRLYPETLLPHRVGPSLLRGFDSSLNLAVFSVRRAMCRQAIGEKLFEQIGVVPLGNVWVAPVMQHRQSTRHLRPAPIERGS